MNSFNLELQLKHTVYAIRNKLTDLLAELKGFKFVTTCVLDIKKEKVMIKQYITFSFNSKAAATINESDIDDLFESIYIMQSIPKSLQDYIYIYIYIYLYIIYK